MDLWPHQENALLALRQTVAQGVKRIVLSSPVGSGKTRLAAAVVEGALNKGKRIAFVVPLITLIDQTVEAFYDQGIKDVGVIQANHDMTDWSRPVQVCSIQTIRSKKAYPQADVVIFDEIHVMHATHREWMAREEWRNVPFIGLSATPWAKGMGKYFETLLTVATTRELIDQGYLSKFRVFATGHPDLRGVKVTAGDYQENQLSDAMQKGTLTADIIDTWMKRWGKDKTLCFAVDRAHAKALQERFVHAGVECGYQDALTPKTERKEIRRQFQSGRIQVLVNIATLTMGADLDCRCLILARPTRSKMLYNQIIGRCLRIAKDKEYALILDHSSTTQELGFVTDLHQDWLDDGREREKAEPKSPLPKECKQCGFLKPPRVSACPNCGFKAAAPEGTIERDGELVEVTDPAAGRRRARKAAKELTIEDKAKFLAELKAYGVMRGKKDGWALHSYREKFGVWPDWSIRDVSPARYPSAATMMWIKHRNIAWAKSKRREESATAGAS